MFEQKTRISDSELLAKWHENQLNIEELAEFETRRVNNQEFAANIEAFEQIQSLASQSNQLHNQPWDKAATVAFPRHKTGHAFQWLPLGAMAMSLLAIVMVVTGFQVQFQNGQLAMGFNLAPSSEQIAQLVDNKLADYQVAQQRLTAQYVSELQAQNTQLTQYLLDTSRVERREDFAELIKFINQQRDDDQRFYARQLNKLESEIYSNTFQE